MAANANPVQLVPTRRFGDDRGWFSETYSAPALAAFGVRETYVQDNHSMSQPAGTLRGLHFQTPPHAQAKLVRCVRGAVFDVAVDLRLGSPTYGRWVAATLTAQNGLQLAVPAGFAHGFLTLEPETEIIYKVSALYAPAHDGGVLWSDPEIAVAWPLAGPRADALAQGRRPAAPRRVRERVSLRWPSAAEPRAGRGRYGASGMSAASPRRVFVTGGAGFIGSALVRHLVLEAGCEVLTYDKLTYAGSLSSLAAVMDHPAHRFVRGDICDPAEAGAAIRAFRPDVITNLAAESHVDRSIDGPRAFVETNLVGTFVMLQAALAYWRGLAGPEAERFRFHQISTDEVFGSLGETGLFTEETAYDPRSPYSATKAGADHLVRAWGHTYGLPVLVTNCSNNYGPFHFPEKLIPLMIIKCLAGEALPVYGRGENVRDWLFVEDHVRALRAVFEGGAPGASYAIGGRNEVTNLGVVEAICSALDTLSPRADGASYRAQIGFVTDRPGHDLRYAIDAGKIERELGWAPQIDFQAGLERTVRWFLANEPWWRAIQSERYAGQRLGAA